MTGSHSHLNTVRVTFQRPLVVSSLEIPQLDGGIFRCGDHDAKYWMEDHPEKNKIEVQPQNNFSYYLVTGALCPDSSYFSGGLGIHSPGDLFSRVGAPEINSFSASDNLLSNSFT